SAERRREAARTNAARSGAEREEIEVVARHRFPQWAPRKRNGSKPRLSAGSLFFFSFGFRSALATSVGAGSGKRSEGHRSRRYEKNSASFLKRKTSDSVRPA